MIVPEAGQLEEGDSVEVEGGVVGEAGPQVLRQELLYVGGEGVHQPLYLHQVQCRKVTAQQQHQAKQQQQQQQHQA